MKDSQQEERRRAVRAGLVEPAQMAPIDPQGAKRRVFERALADLDQLHFRVLEMLCEPMRWFLRVSLTPPSLNGTPDAMDPEQSVRTMAKAAFRDMPDDLLDLVVRELFCRGFVTIDSADRWGREPSGFATAMGRELLAFVRG